MSNQETPPICNYEGSSYQQTFWAEGGRAYEDRVEEIALHRLLPVGGRSLLELGAGAGRNTPRYQGFEQIVLLDYSLSQLQAAQAELGKSPHYVYVAANAYRLPFVSSYFDAATMIRTLHHMVDAPLALAQVRQVMKTGGTFILEYANKKNIKAILRYLLRRQSWNPFDKEPVEFVKLNFDFHPAAIRSWLNRVGFIVERQLTVSHFRLGSLKRWMPLGLLVQMDALAQLTGNWWQFSPSVFTRNRAVGETPATAPGAFFRCLSCGGVDFQQLSNELICQGCRKRWPVVDGIYDFRDLEE